MLVYLRWHKVIDRSTASPEVWGQLDTSFDVTACKVNCVYDLMVIFYNPRGYGGYIYE